MLMFYENGFIYTKNEIDKITKIHRSLKPIQQISFYGLIEHYLLKIIENFKSQFDSENPHSDFIYYFLIIDFDKVIERVQLSSNNLTESYKKIYPHPSFELDQVSKQFLVKEDLTKHLLIQQPLYYTSFYKEYKSFTVIIEQDHYQSILKTLLNTVLFNSFSHITLNYKRQKIDEVNFNSYSHYLMGEIQESQWHRHRNKK